MAPMHYRPFERIKCYDNGMRQQRYWVTLGIILTFGLLIRLWQLGGASYWIDESYSIALAKAIVQHGWPITESGLLITRSMLYHYLLAGVYWFTGESSAWWLRLPAVLFGIGAVVAATAVARQLFSQRIAVITAVLMASSVWEIAWSRQVRMYSALQCATWITVYCYLRWRQQPSAINVVLLTLSVAVTFAVHELGSIVLVFLLLHRLLEHILNKPTSTKQLISYSLSLVVSLVALAGLMHFGFGYALVNYWPNYWFYLFTTLPITLLLAVAVFCQRKLITLSVVWLITNLVVTVGLYSFAIELLQYRYLFFVLPAIYIVSAVGIDALWFSARHRVVWRGIVICAAIVASALGEYTLWPRTQYLLESDSQQNPFHYKSITPQPDFASAYTKLLATTDETGKTVPVISPYPTIQALYAPNRTMSTGGCLYVDLTGTAPEPPTAAERYTACPYVTATTLCQALQSGSLVLLDQFARQRIQPELWNIIAANSEPIWQLTTPPWSNLTLYQPKTGLVTLDCHNL